MSPGLSRSKGSTTLSHTPANGFVRVRQLRDNVDGWSCWLSMRLAERSEMPAFAAAAACVFFVRFFIYNLTC